MIKILTALPLAFCSLAGMASAAEIKRQCGAVFPSQVSGETRSPCAGRRMAWLRKVLSLDNLAGDVRSAIIGSLVGAIVGMAVGWLSTRSPNVEFLVAVSNGFAQPKGLFDLAEESGKFKFEFSPAELRNVYVCEHKFVTGQTWKSAALAYLNEYSVCFYLSDLGENKYVVLPNRASGLLREEVQRGGDKLFLCKCPKR